MRKKEFLGFDDISSVAVEKELIRETEKGEVEKEQSEETPEQKREREILENIEALHCRAEEYVKQEKVKNITQALKEGTPVFDIKESIQNNSERPEMVDNFLTNKELLQLVEKASILLGLNVSADDQYLWNELKENPISLAFFELLREENVKIKTDEKHITLKLNSILPNKKTEEMIFHPEFQKSITEFRNTLQYNPCAEDFLNKWEYRSEDESESSEIIFMHKNRKRLLSEEGVDLIEYLGGYKNTHAKGYVDLLNVPQPKEILQELQKVYDYEPSDVINSGHYFIEDVSRYKEKVFSPLVVEFFNQLRKDYGIKFQLNDIATLILAADERDIELFFTPEQIEDFDQKEKDEFERIKNLKTRLSDEKTKEFIKTTFADTSSFSELQEIAYIKEENFPFIRALSERFGYKFKRGDLWNDDQILDFFSANPQAQEKLFSHNKEELASMENRLVSITGNERAVKEHPFRVFEVIANDSLKFLESIKEELPNTARLVFNNPDALRYIPKGANKKFENIKTFITPKVCEDFLYSGNLAHEALEEIKEKDLITVQTYNRLYAARRRYTGYNSYAYHPKEGEIYPAINVSDYANDLGEKENEKNKLEVDTTLDSNGFLDGNIGYQERLKIYPETYASYQATKEKFNLLTNEEKGKFLEQFSWYSPPKKYEKDPEYELLVNNVLSLGIAENGHAHFYATPFGIISGCVSEFPESSGIFDKNHLAAKGIGRITGHREMLLDYIARHRDKNYSYKEEAKNIPESALTIEFENMNLSKELQEMVLPSGIPLSEVFTNLHLEQYLHNTITPDKYLLDMLGNNLRTGKMLAMIDNKEIALNDIIPQGSKIILKGLQKG